MVATRINVVLTSVPNEVLKSAKQSLEATSVVVTEGGAVLDGIPLSVILE